MAKFSVLLALCFFFCVASAQLDPSGLIVEFDSSLFTAGANVSSWTNTGSLGGVLTATGGSTPVVDSCGGAGQGVVFNGESYTGNTDSPLTFSASDAAVVIVVASSASGSTGGILTSGPTGGPADDSQIAPGALFDTNYVQDANTPIGGDNVNTFSASSGAAVAFAFVYETPIGTTINDFWISPDNSGTNVLNPGSVANTIGWLSIGDRLGATGFVGCIHYLAIYQVVSTPVNEDALSTTLLDLAGRFNVATNTTTSPSPAPGTTGTTGTTGSTSGTTGTTGSRTTGRRATTHVSSATIPAVPSLLFAAIVSFFLFFLW